MSFGFKRGAFSLLKVHTSKSLLYKGTGSYQWLGK